MTSRGSTSRSSRSLIWHSFIEVSEDCSGTGVVAEKATCSTCNEVVKHCGNTKNMWQHMQRHHPKLYTELSKKASTIKETAESAGDAAQSLKSAKNDKDFKRQTSVSSFLTKRLKPEERIKIDNSLAYMVGKDMQPIRIVEDAGFLAYTHAQNSSYQPPSRKTLSKMLDSKYQLLKDDMKGELLKLNSVNLTCDMWTSRATEGYLTITAHGLNDEFQHINVVLETQYIPESHTGDNQADVMMKVIDDWGLKGKVFAVITDNGSSAVKCVSKLLSKGYCSVHLRCSAHTLQLSINDVLSDAEISDLVKRCKNTVSLFHHSTTMTSELQKAQKQVNLPQNKLIQSVPTRWNSTYLMLGRLIEQEAAVTLALCSYKPPKTKKKAASAPSQTCATKLIKADDFAVIRMLVDVLAPFEEATTILSAEQYCTSSVAHPLLEHLIKELDDFTKANQPGTEEDDAESVDSVHEELHEDHGQQVVEADTEIEENEEGEGDNEETMTVRQVAEQLRTSVMNRFQSVLFSPVYRVSSLLDPRFKTTYCDVADIVGDLKDEMLNALKHIKNRELSALALANNNMSNTNITGSTTSTSTSSGVILEANAPCATASSQHAEAAATDSVSTSTTERQDHNDNSNRHSAHRETENKAVSGIGNKRPSFWQAVALEQVAAKRLRNRDSDDSDDRARIDSELTAYRCDETPINSAGDVMTFWASNKERLPVLSHVARKYMGVPATSVPSERVFSSAGYIVNNRRASLKPSSVNSLVFLHANWVM